MTKVEDGRSKVEGEGFTYHPHFVTQDESEELIKYFASLHPIWEERHPGPHKRNPSSDGMLTRPVYWLGAWQFASLGYYAEPLYVDDRCVKAEPFPKVMQDILDRSTPILENYHSYSHAQVQYALPNTCLINYYGRKVGQGVPVDCARLKMHQDGEPGPVIMLCVGQAGLLEFVEPDNAEVPIHSQWIRHRSLVVFSGPLYKEELYHRIVKVRTGALPRMQSNVRNFELRRVSVSFRHIPPDKIVSFGTLPPASRGKIRGYVDELAKHSAHFAFQKRQSVPKSMDPE